MLLRVFTVAIAVLIAACAPSSPPNSLPRTPGAMVDCSPLAAEAFTSGGLIAPRPTLPQSAVDCVWKAYKAGTPLRLSVTTNTVDGAQVPSTIVFDGVGVLVTRDLSLDRFSATADRRVWSWRCGTMTQRTWTADAQRYSLEMGGCTGDGTTATFP